MNPCPEGKTRNPKTGRCKKDKVYPECPEGKTRHPETKRCRKDKMDKVYPECPEGKTRHPKTKRCRKDKPIKKTVAQIPPIIARQIIALQIKEDQANMVLQKKRKELERAELRKRSARKITKAAKNKLLRKKGAARKINKAAKKKVQQLRKKRAARKITKAAKKKVQQIRRKRAARKITKSAKNKIQQLRRNRAARKITKAAKNKVQQLRRKRAARTITKAAKNKVNQLRRKKAARKITNAAKNKVQKLRKKKTIKNKNIHDKAQRITRRDDNTGQRVAYKSVINFDKFNKRNKNKKKTPTIVPSSKAPQSRAIPSPVPETFSIYQPSKWWRECSITNTNIKNVKDIFGKSSLPNKFRTGENACDYLSRFYKINVKNVRLDTPTYWINEDGAKKYNPINNLVYTGKYSNNNDNNVFVKIYSVIPNSIRSNRDIEGKFHDITERQFLYFERVHDALEEYLPNVSSIEHVKSELIPTKTTNMGVYVTNVAYGQSLKKSISENTHGMRDTVLKGLGKFMAQLHVHASHGDAHLDNFIIQFKNKDQFVITMIDIERVVFFGNMTNSDKEGLVHMADKLRVTPMLYDIIQIHLSLLQADAFGGSFIFIDSYFEEMKKHYKNIDFIMDFKHIVKKELDIFNRKGNEDNNKRIQRAILYRNRIWKEYDVQYWQPAMRIP